MLKILHADIQNEYSPDDAGLYGLHNNRWFILISPAFRWKSLLK